MKVWLDDIRPAPKGWKWVKTAQDAINELKKGEFIIDEISLDHDLGSEKNGTGYDVMKWIEKAIFFGEYCPPKLIKFHTSNPVGRKAMEDSLKFIKTYGLHYN